MRGLLPDPHPEAETEPPPARVRPDWGTFLRHEEYLSARREMAVVAEEMCVLVLFLFLWAMVGFWDAHQENGWGPFTSALLAVAIIHFVLMMWVVPPLARRNRELGVLIALACYPGTVAVATVVGAWWDIAPMNGAFQLPFIGCILARMFRASPGEGVTSQTCEVGQACPACSGSRVLEGSVTDSRRGSAHCFLEGLRRTVLGRPSLELTPSVRVCLDCGLLWTWIDAQEANRQVRRLEGTSAEIAPTAV